MYIGRYDTEEAAARAYDEAILKHHTEEEINWIMTNNDLYGISED